jgi:hypothetical protein
MSRSGGGGGGGHEMSRTTHEDETRADQKSQHCGEAPPSEIGDHVVFSLSLVPCPHMGELVLGPSGHGRQTCVIVEGKGIRDRSFRELFLEPLCAKTACGPLKLSAVFDVSHVQR